MTRSSALPLAPSSSGVDSARDSNWRSLSASNTSSDAFNILDARGAISVSERRRLKTRYCQAR